MVTYITSWTELAAMSSNLAEDYILSNNLNKSDSDYPGIWTPIGDLTTKFTGSFDGQNYTIEGLTYYSTSTDYVGLFGYINGATISNIILDVDFIQGDNYIGCLAGRADASIISDCSVNVINFRGDDYAGGLVGYLSSTSISDCSVHGNVYGIDDRIGGIVGYATSSSSIVNSYFVGCVYGADYVGGIVGYAASTSIEKSYSNGVVSCLNTYSGGIVGYATSSSSISDSYSLGLAFGKTYVGGLAGSIVGGNITNCFSVASPSGISSVGVIAGNSTATITSCYWDTERTGISSSSYGSGKTTSQMRAETTFIGWDFISDWSISEGNDYPKIQGITNAITIFSIPTASGPNFLNIGDFNTINTDGPDFTSILTFYETNINLTAFELYIITPPIYSDVDFVLILAPGSTITNPYIKISGTMNLKPIYFKAAGVFIEKPMKVKMSGVFQ